MKFCEISLNLVKSHIGLLNDVKVWKIVCYILLKIEKFAKNLINFINFHMCHEKWSKFCPGFQQNFTVFYEKKFDELLTVFTKFCFASLHKWTKYFSLQKF